MHVLLVSLGSDGDVFPFVGLGIRLRARGHQVTLASSEHYRALASESGFGFRALASDAEMEGLLGNPDVWHPLKSALVGARWGRKGLTRQYRVIEEAAREPGTVIVAYPPMFAARVVQEKLGCRLISVVAMPWMILSKTAPPALPGAARFPWLQSSGAARIGWRIGERLTDLLMGRELNRLRRSVGLDGVRDIYRWCFSQEKTIGLFPDWYAPPQLDWPRNTFPAGFSMYDGAEAKELPAELREFCQSGPRPVVFTFGTGMKHGRELFQAALECCEALKVRGLFLTKYSAQVPEALPETVRFWPYAPFSQLFPQCAAVVHHGGAGTTAQALAAGVPQLIMPFAWDQPDNAFRVKALGAGDWIKPQSTAGEMANALAGIITGERQARCRELAGKFTGMDGLDKAAELVE